MSTGDEMTVTNLILLYQHYSISTEKKLFAAKPEHKVHLILDILSLFQICSVKKPKIKQNNMFCNNKKIHKKSSFENSELAYIRHDNEI